MGCILSRELSGQNQCERTNASDHRRANQIEAEPEPGELQKTNRTSDIERGILMSLDEIDQLTEVQRVELVERRSRAAEMSREQSLKRKLDKRETKVLEKWNKTSSRTQQLTSFISLLINRRKRRSSARIEVADLVPAARVPVESPPEVGASVNSPPDSNLAQGTAMPREAEKGLTTASQSGEGGVGAGDNSTLLFTSVQQLCYEIINRKLVRQQAQHKQPNLPSDPVGNLTIELAARGQRQHHQHHNTLCLFVFGLQGSSLGELSFELVEHSSLVDFIQGRQPHSDRAQLEPEADEPFCPLYHYIDVSTLIVANIDQRIGLYNRLVSQTLRARRRQAGGVEEGEQNDQVADQLARRTIGVLSSGSSSQDDARDEDDDYDEANSARIEADNDSTSLWSTREASISSDVSARQRRSLSPVGGRARPTSAGQMTESNPCDHHQHHNQMSHDQFGMDTLSTRQRSILQLKLIKYATCVTAKWVTILIHAEIGRLESQLRACSGDAHSQQSRPARVYLINLVPNQLSLFRSCLYLQQELPLNNFRHAFWAIKFERRTSIRVVGKERDSDPPLKRPDEDVKRRASDQEAARAGGSVHQENQKLFHKIRLPQIKLPGYLILRSHSDSNIASASSPLLGTGANKSRAELRQIEAVASNLLANSVNEKLGPKISETFASQFRSLNKLTRLRYNPTRNYNYATASDVATQIGVNHADRSSERPDTETLVSRTNTNQINCASRLRHVQLEPSDELDQWPGRPGSSPDHQRPSFAVDEVSRPLSPASNPSNGSDFERCRLLLKPDPLERHHLAPSTSPSSLVSNDSSQLSSISWQHSAGLHARVSPTNSTALTSAGCFKWAVELELIDAQANANKWYSKPGDFGRDATTPSSLELLGADSAATSSLAADLRHTPPPAPFNCCLHVYLPPTRRSSSRSPLGLVSTGNGRRGPSSGGGPASGEGRGCASVQASVCHTGHYYLVSTPVAYANGKSQPILEAKTVHKRVVRYSSTRSDWPKLAKLIGKAEGQLKADLSSWLMASIEQGPLIGAQMNIATSDHNHHQHSRHHTSAQHKLAGSMTPHLVTYTIRLDVTKLLKRTSAIRLCNPDTNHEDQATLSHVSGGHKTEHVPGQLHSNDPAHLLQTQPERPALSKRPASALAGHLVVEHTNGVDRCSSSRSSLHPSDSPANGFTGGRSSLSACSSSNHPANDPIGSKPRHVQFKLNKAPPQGENYDCDSHSQSQKRTWVRESLFISCSDMRLSPAIKLLVNDLFAHIADGREQSSREEPAEPFIA